MKRYAGSTLIGVFCFCLLLSALVVVKAMRPTEYEDPFVPFDRIVPGQPTSALDWSMCDQRYYFDEMGDGGFYCHINLDDGPFKSVMITARGDKISVVWFSVNNLQVGDLVYRWGRPDRIQRTRRQHILRWTDGVYATVQLGGWYSLSSPVKFVALRKAQIKGEAEM